MEQKTNIKSGDIVRLTDPSSNGEVVRVEKVDEHGYMDFIGGSQHITTAKQIMISPYLNTNSNTISETCHEITRNTGVKLYPESAVNYWKHRAEIAEQNNALNEKLLDKEHNKLLDAKDEDIVQCEMSMFERICQVCRYRCAKIGDTYKCAYEKSFGTLCNSNNCEFLK